MRTIGLAYLLFIGLVACGNKDSGEGRGRGKVYSCNSESEYRCTEDTDSPLKIDSLEKLCTSRGDSFKLAQLPCPSANVVGTCARRGSKELYYQGVDAEELAMTQKSCTDHGGTWSK